MRNRTRAVYVLLTILLSPTVLPATVTRPTEWEVTFAIRLVPKATNGPVSVAVAVPPEDARQKITEVEVSPRGLTVIDNRGSDPPQVILRGRLRRARRAAITYRVSAAEDSQPLPAIRPVSANASEVLPFLAPSPLVQSRSLLVREFLETHVAPALLPGQTDLVRAILFATRREIHYRPDGKSLALDALRRRQAKRVGIERTFTSLLRCAGIPARVVEGINLKSATRRKRVFWTEIWGNGRWWPVSASEGWAGRLPEHYLALARNGTRVLVTEGAVHATYRVQTFPRKDR